MISSVWEERSSKLPASSDLSSHAECSDVSPGSREHLAPAPMGQRMLGEFEEEESMDGVACYGEGHTTTWSCCTPGHPAANASPPRRSPSPLFLPPNSLLPCGKKNRAEACGARKWEGLREADSVPVARVSLCVTVWGMAGASLSRGSVETREVMHVSSRLFSPTNLFFSRSDLSTCKHRRRASTQAGNAGRG